MLIEKRCGGDVAVEHVKRGEVAPVEGEKKVSQPSILLAVLKSIENWMQQKFAKVINTVR